MASQDVEMEDKSEILIPAGIEPSSAQKRFLQLRNAPRPRKIYPSTLKWVKKHYPSSLEKVLMYMKEKEMSATTATNTTTTVSTSVPNMPVKTVTCTSLPPVSSTESEAVAPLPPMINPTSDYMQLDEYGETYFSINSSDSQHTQSFL